MAEMLDPTAAVARFVLSTRYEDLDSDLIHHVKRSITDCVGASMAALDQPGLEMVLSLQRELGGKPQASVWGTGERLSVAQAGLVNGYLAHILDFDDTYLAPNALLHANCSVLPAALAVAEWQASSGRDLIAAFAVGYETEARLARTVGHGVRGWHTIGTCGPFAATAAAGRLLGLNQTQLQHAFGLVVLQAGGTAELHGSSGKGLLAGNSAHNGINAALLARRGLISSPRIFENRRGCFPFMYSDAPDPEQLTDGLGERWELRRAAFKPFSCGIGAQPLMDAVIRLRNAHRLTPDRVAAIEGRVNPFVLVAQGKTEPRTGLESKFSVYHCAAVCLVDGIGAQPQFSDARVNAPAVVEVRRRVTAIADPAIAPHEAQVTITTTDGVKHELHVEHGKGTQMNPMTDDELRAKFQFAAEPFIGLASVERTLAMIDRLETVADAGHLARAIAPAGVA